MSIPAFHAFLGPVLAYAAGNDECRLRDTYDVMADQFGLSEEDRRELLPSGRQPLFQNRIAWAVTHLKKAQLLESRGRGVFAITDRGRQVLQGVGGDIKLADLEQFKEFREFRRQGSSASGQDEGAQAPSPESVAADAPSQTPEESLASAWRVLDAQLEVEVLNQVREVSPTFFEHVAVDVLVAMGYGGSRTEAPGFDSYSYKSLIARCADSKFGTTSAFLRGATPPVRRTGSSAPGSCG